MILALLFGYLCGSIPFGLLLTRWAGTPDLRTIGSGNIGATNVLRTGRKDLAALTLFLDGLKGAAAVLIAVHAGRPDWALPAAIGAFIGHVYPVWLDFKGGKGVATFLGSLFAVYFTAGLTFGITWLLVAAWTRYSSAAALSASAITPYVLYVSGDEQGATAYLMLTGLLWYKHKGNLARLMAGDESRIGEQTV